MKIYKVFVLESVGASWRFLKPFQEAQEAISGSARKLQEAPGSKSAYFLDEFYSFLELPGASWRFLKRNALYSLASWSFLLPYKGRKQEAVRGEIISSLNCLKKLLKTVPPLWEPYFPFTVRFSTLFNFATHVTMYTNKTP